MTRVLISAICVMFFASSVFSAEGDRESKVAKDKSQFDSKSDWLYNKLDEAYELAQKTGKPIMAVMRCIPCEECVKLDDDLIDNDPVIAPLMEKFILVRLTGTNGLDLNTFQYDTDQSFAVFFLNAEKTVYGRFGTRSHRTEWITDVSVEGMARAMKGALALHQQYPANRDQFVDKSNKPTEFATPEKFPTLNKKPGRLNWEGRDFAKGVVKNCIHCHEISEARMEYYLAKELPIPEELLYPYPHPKTIGLVLDPEHRARVLSIQSGSAAEAAGLQEGDDILRMNGQPLLSMADVQWVLHHLAPEGDSIKLQIRRGEQIVESAISLPASWRRKGDTSWRTGHWILRRSMLGGMKLAGEQDHLRVQSVGNWGPFAVAKNAGVRKDDIVQSVDGQEDFRRESDVLDYINQNKRPGDYVQLELVRNSKPVSVRYQIQ